MLESPAISIAVGLVLGFLTGLGTGGGSLLILWLTLVQQMSAAQARIINLMFFLPSAMIATLINWFRRRIPWKKVLLPACAGTVAAAVFALLEQKMNTEGLEKLFGVLLIVMGIRELTYRPRNPR